MVLLALVVRSKTNGKGTVLHKATKKTGLYERQRTVCKWLGTCSLAIRLLKTNGFPSVQEQLYGPFVPVHCRGFCLTVPVPVCFPIPFVFFKTLAVCFSYSSLSVPLLATVDQKSSNAAWPKFIFWLVHYVVNFLAAIPYLSISTI